jgi:transposase
VKNQDSDQNPKSLRISIDSKANVKIGNLSRGGKARTLEPKQADDHDMNWYETLVPFGILNLDTAQLSIYWGTSAETSDFIVDCLVRWWKDNQPNYPDLEEWGINLDGGPSVRSDRTQFKKRMVELSQAMGITIRLIYYPPYHRKYNAIERCWAVLENYWNGAILDSVEAALRWSAGMTWKGLSPRIHLIEQTYPKGVKVSTEDLEPLLYFWKPSLELAKWDITIIPA